MNIKSIAIAVLCCAVLMPAIVSADVEINGEKIPDPETPVLFIGDSMMRILGHQCEKAFKKADVQPAVAFSSLGSGLVRPTIFDWNAKIKELFDEHKPKTVFIALGTNDRQPIETLEDGHVIVYDRPEWVPEYTKRIEAVMDECIELGATRVVWFLLPDMKEIANQEHADLVNQIVVELSQVESRKDKVSYFDIDPVINRKPGKYNQFYVDKSGAALSVRDPDGVHLAAPGGKLVAEAILKTFFHKK